MLFVELVKSMRASQLRVSAAAPANLYSRSVPMLPWRKGGRKGAEILERFVLRRMAQRVAGHILRQSKAWKKALVHISEHFSLDILKKNQKRAHTVFLQKFRSNEAVEALVRQTVKAPSQKKISKETGERVLHVEKRFDQLLGETFAQTANGIEKRVIKNAKGEIVESGDCYILRVVVDCTGRVLSAYPIEFFFKG